MTELPQVTQKFGVKLQKQWGKGILFVQDGAKWSLNSKRLKWIGICLFLVSVTVIMFQEDKTGLSNRKSEISDASIVSQSGPLIITSPAETGHSQTTIKKQSRATPNSSFGSQVVVRPRATQIPPGFFVSASFITGASNGPVEARLEEDISVNGDIIARKGTTFFGRGSSTEERLFVKFEKMIFKDGTFESILAHACDFGDKISGLKGSKIGRNSLKMTGGIGLGFLGGLSEGLQESEVQSGVEIKRPTLKNAILKGTAQAALEQSREIISELKDKQPIIEVKAGTPFFILFDELSRN